MFAFTDTDVRTVANLTICLILLMLLIAFGLDMRVPYPSQVIQGFTEPIVRLISYVALYNLAYYNPVVSILAFMCLVFLHIDYVNLATKKDD